MAKYSDYRSRQQLVTQHFPVLRPALDFLTQQQDEHFALFKRIVDVHGDGREAPLFTADIVLLSVMNRSLDLIEGFAWAYDRWNLSTAAPIVRMQVDNLLRLALLLKADAQSGVPELLLSGKPLRSHRDPLSPGTKQKLTDKCLRDHARAAFPWLDQVYEKASGLVHFSSVHVGVTLAVSDDDQVFGRFPSDTDRYPFDFLEQVLWAMNESTSGLIQVVATFADGKAEAARRWPQVE